MAVATVANDVTVRKVLRLIAALAGDMGFSSLGRLV
jgi:hypothetical protein